MEILELPPVDDLRDEQREGDPGNEKPDGWCKAERERRASRAYHRTKTMLKSEGLSQEELDERLSAAFQLAKTRYDQGLADEFPKLR